MRREAIVWAWMIGGIGCGRVDFDPVVDGPGGPTPAARYLLDDDPTDGVEDATSHGHTGTCAPCPTLAAAIDAEGYLFAGELVRVPTAPELESVTLSAAAWVRPDGSGMCIVGKPFGGLTANSWQLCISPTRQLLACLSDQPCGASRSGVFTNGAWRHVMLTYDGTTVRAWLGGERVIDMPAQTRFDGSDILIGGDLDNGSLFMPFRGVIDDVRIWDHALTDDEVAEIVAP